MVLAAGAVVWWHGLAVQDARPLASKGFRPPFGLGRVTFLCVAKEQSPIERPPPLIRPTSSGSFGSPACPTARADGPLAFAIHDDRPVGEVAAAVRQAGLQPVFKDWEPFLGR